MWRGGWTIVHRVAGPSELVLAQPDTHDGRLASFCRPTARAVVIGSTQSLAEIDDERRKRLGYELLRRRSGGGAVIVAPAAQAWVDLFVPRDDPLHEDDVGRAAQWVADLWSEVLEVTAAGGVIEPIRAYAPTRYSRAVCFSGLGPGEVAIDGRKVVGVSQRRGRSGAWFFTMVLCTNDQRALSELLVLGDSDREALGTELSTRVGTASASADLLEDAVLSSLAGRGN
jgi:lipoate---protein ligase